LLDLVQLLREEEVDAGRVVMREDDYGSRLYIAVSGRYRVSRAGTLLAELGERSVFGELALLDPERRSATVEAIEDGLLFTLDHEDFQEALAGSIQLAQSVIRMLCRRLRDTGARISVSADSARPASGLAS
jgi:CRP-like cAMP-binding protein